MGLLICSQLQASQEAQKRWGSSGFAFKAPKEIANKEGVGTYWVGAIVLNDKEEDEAAIFGTGSSWVQAFLDAHETDQDKLDMREAAVRAYQIKHGEISGDE